jgi:5-methylcytosine-specific restriction endonuclease McrA
VLDKKKRPLMPCKPGRAKEMLDAGRAVVHRLAPFTIRLKDRIGGATQPVRMLLDPGSKTTGIAVVREESIAPVVGATEAMPDTDGPTRHVLFAAELAHRGGRIHKQMQQRKGRRSGRRSRNLRYRAPRFDNRTKPVGWLAPSLRHRVEMTLSWVTRFCRWAPVTAISVERVRFDMQAMERPGIQGVEYQQGTLLGYEVREYVLEKWGRSCVYCDVKNVPLNADHLVPRVRGGSRRESNLAPACVPCNRKKGARPLAEFLSHDPKRLARITSQMRRPLSDAAAVNSTRWALDRALRATGLPVEASSGGRTKFNRTRLGVAKSHAGDAVCVGRVGKVVGWPMATLGIASVGRGSYQRHLVSTFGFPRGKPKPRTKSVYGFRTGDLVRAVVPKGKYQGAHVGRVAVRTTGKFDVHTTSDNVHGIPHQYCRLTQRADGYSYGVVPMPTSLLLVQKTVS